ncbi:MAG: hypothetical protein HYX28_05815 [Candidatus Koribacter versatilis]|uniref:Glycosyltransferase RgtA/B/C/D-like domain-containing protein n=1 Tax=Candidatus Korobacter versatilis TaxID=658062 RepID=A0A932A7R7_9BACT|nr:hypothetical protein [Candidatus Koribacter versatilis]
MPNPFSRDRFGRPQVFAILLLLAFLAQALYVIARRPLAGGELGYIQTGELRLRGQSQSAPHFVSPLIAVIAAIPVVAAGRTSLVADDARDADLPIEDDSLRWPARLPFVLIGLLVGGSLWYVARRLYGNAGGYIALALYVFSPAVALSAHVGPGIVAMLGVFGIIYISIALAHTFYPSDVGFLRECRPRWKRVGLLVAAILLALGAAPGALLVLPIALAFMLYLLPAPGPNERSRWWMPFAVLAITTALALAALLALNGLRAAALAQQVSLSVAVLSWHFAATRFGLYAESLLWLTHYPALVVFLLLALAAYLASRRARYFGNTAPLLVIVLLWLLAVGGLAPDTLAYGAIPLRALPFLFLVLAGVAADMLDAKGAVLRRDVAAGMIAALLLSHAIIGMLELKRAGGVGHPFEVQGQMTSEK